MEEDSSGSNVQLVAINQIEFWKELRAERDKTITEHLELHAAKLKELCEYRAKHEVRHAEENGRIDVLRTRVNIALAIGGFLAGTAVAAAIAMWAK